MATSATILLLLLGFSCDRASVTWTQFFELLSFGLLLFWVVLFGLLLFLVMPFGLLLFELQLFWLLLFGLQLLRFLFLHAFPFLPLLSPGLLLCVLRVIVSTVCHHCLSPLCQYPFK